MNVAESLVPQLEVGRDRVGYRLVGLVIAFLIHLGTAVLEGGEVREHLGDVLLLVVQGFHLQIEEPVPLDEVYALPFAVFFG